MTNKKKYLRIILGIGILGLLTICYLQWNKTRVTYIKGDTEFQLKYEKEILDIGADENKDKVALLGYDEKSVFYSTFEDTYCIYKNDGKTVKKLYESDSNMFLYEGEYKNQCIVSEIIYDDEKEQERGVVRLISKSGVKEILNEKTYVYPDVQLIGDYLLMMYSEKNENIVTEKLLQYCFSTEEIKVIKENTVKAETEEDIYTGTIISPFGGYNDGAVTQEVEYNNESECLDEAGKKSLYYYNFQTEEYTKLPIPLERKVNYVAGDSQCVLVSDYAYKEPLHDTGRIYFLEGKDIKVLQLEGVESGNDILDSYRIEDSIMILRTMGGDIYIVDLEHKNYERIKEAESYVRVYGKSMAYINEKNQMVVYRFE